MNSRHPYATQAQGIQGASAILPMLSTIHTPLCRRCQCCEIGLRQQALRALYCRVCEPRVEREAAERTRRFTHPGVIHVG